MPSFEGFAARFEGEVVEIATGHDAMITRPADLAGRLRKVGTQLAQIRNKRV